MEIGNRELKEMLNSKFKETSNNQILKENGQMKCKGTFKTEK